MTQLTTPRAFSALRRFTRREQAHVRCELCSALLGEAHEHLYEPQARAASCACQACALLFSNETDGRYRRMQPRVARVRGAVLGARELEALGIPVRLVCLCPSTLHDRVFAMYPSPAGAIEAEVSLTQWQALTEHQAQLTLTPEIEAMIIDARTDDTRVWRVSIDVCHRLLGQLRSKPGRSGFASFEAELLALDGGRRG